MARILIFSRTTGYRHVESIAAGIAMIGRSARAHGVEVDATEDPAAFDDLGGYDAVVWLQVSGDVLGPAQRASFDAFLRGGGGFAGVHGASDAERSWPEYADVVGARFLYHPTAQAQTAEVVVADKEHPSTRHLPARWTWTEEWYVFDRDPRGHVDVLLTVDESTYDVEEHAMGADHPLSWHGRYGAGRTWYTALGHHPEAYEDDDFAAHVWGGVSSVLRG